MRGLQQDALRAQAHMCSAWHSTMAQVVRNALGNMKYFRAQQKVMRAWSSGQLLLGKRGGALFSSGVLLVWGFFVCLWGFLFVFVFLRLSEAKGMCWVQIIWHHRVPGMSLVHLSLPWSILKASAVGCMNLPVNLMSWSSSQLEFLGCLGAMGRGCPCFPAQRQWLSPARAVSRSPQKLSKPELSNVLQGEQWPFPLPLTGLNKGQAGWLSLYYPFWKRFITLLPLSKRRLLICMLEIGI